MSGLVSYAPVLATALVFGSSLVLGGCAEFKPVALLSTQTMRTFNERTLATAEVQKYVSAHRNGSSPTQIATWDMESLVLAAFYFSPELDLARAKHATAAAVAQTASQRPNPSLQMPFEYTTNPKPGESPYTLGLGLDIPIETAGKRGYRIAAANQLSIAAQFEVGDVAWQVRSRLRAQLLDLFAAQRRSPLLEKQLQTREQIVQMVDKRLAVGAVSTVEVHQARAALLQGQLELAKASQQVSESLAGAASVIGIPTQALEKADLRLDAFLEAPPSVPETALRESALLNRADLLAALADYEASQAALQLEVANQYPDIHLGPGYTFDAGAHKIVLSLSGITLPLFNQNQGQIAEAKARRQEAAGRYNAAQAQAISRSDRALDHFRAASMAHRVAESLQANQEMQLAAVRKAFEVGETDRLGLALAEVETDSVALAWVDSLIEVQRAIGELEGAMQLPLSAGPSAAP